MAKLILLRHFKSEWNKDNRFTGWTDVPLAKEGITRSKSVAKKLAPFKIDKVYTSPLKRNKDSVFLILKHLNKDLPVVIDKALNERNYGKLQGQNKNVAKKKYGYKQVQLWRRGWDSAPPEGESLKDVYNRVAPFYKKHIEKDLKAGKNILVVASHNSLRALVKHIEKISDKDIVGVEIKTGNLKKYEIDK